MPNDQLKPLLVKVARLPQLSGEIQLNSPSIKPKGAGCYRPTELVIPNRVHRLDA
jgi:hypothetical protein